MYELATGLPTGSLTQPSHITTTEKMADNHKVEQVTQYMVIK